MVGVEFFKGCMVYIGILIFVIVFWYLVTKPIAPW